MAAVVLPQVIAKTDLLKVVVAKMTLQQIRIAKMTAALPQVTAKMTYLKLL